MKEYFKTDDKQYAFKPKTFNETPKQRVVKINFLSKMQVDTKSEDWRIVKLDQKRFFVFIKNVFQYNRALIGGDAWAGLINLDEKTLKDIKPPTVFPSEQVKNDAKTTWVKPAFCKLENEIVAFCGSKESSFPVCVLKDDKWEFITPSIVLSKLAYLTRGGISAQEGFYNYSKENGLRRDSIFSEDRTRHLRAVPTGTTLVRAAVWDNHAQKIWDKQNIQGMLCPVDLEAGWVEGNTHYAFDGETLIITEFIQDDVIEIKE